MLYLETKHSLSNRIVFFGICVLLVFAPLAFGSVHVWAYSVVMIGIFGLGVMLMVDRLVRRGALEWIKTPMDWPLLLLLVLIAIQILPLSLPVLKLVSPLTAADKETLSSILKSAGHDVSQWPALAYYRHPAVLEGLKLSAYILMFYLVLNLADSRRRIDILIYVFVAVGLFEALYAIYQVFSKIPMVWWWKARAGAGRYASGTYVGSNHFAGYMEIVVPLTLGFMLAQKKRARRMLSGLGGKRAWVQRAVAWFAPESANPRMVFLFFSALVMTVSLLLSASRGGILSLTFGVLVISALFLSKRRYSRYGTAAILFCLIAFAYGAYVGMDATLGKFQRTETSFSNRLLTSKSMLPMISDYPYLGVGWGNFRYLYPRYVPKEYDGVSSSGYSHNDWLEAVVETGIPGGILILSAFVLFLGRTVGRWKIRHDPHAIGIGAGVLAGVLSLGFHSLSDFNMHIPANPLALAAAAALGYAAVHRKEKGVRESFSYQKSVFGWGRGGIGLLAVGIAAACFAALYSGGHLLSEMKCPTEWNSTLNLNWNPHLSEIKSAAAKNRLNAEYRWKEANFFITAKTQDELLRKEHNEKAIAGLEEAVRLNPGQGLHWFYLGKRYSFRSYDPYGYLERWLPQAERCFDMALRCAPLDPTVLFDVGWYWVWRSSILPESLDPSGAGEKTDVRRQKPEAGEENKVEKIEGFEQGHPFANQANNPRIRFREDGIRKFQELFSRSLDIRPDRWKQAVDRVQEYFPGDAVALGIVSEADGKLKSEVLKYLVSTKFQAPNSKQ